MIRDAIDGSARASDAALDAALAGQSGEISKGIRRGLYGTGAGLSQFVGGAAGALGAGNTSQGAYNLAHSLEQQGAAPELAPRVGSVQDIRGIRDVPDYVAGKFGEMVPMIGLGLGATALSGGTALGGIAANTALMAPLEIGDVVARQRAANQPVDMGQAAAYGLGSAGLQSVIPGVVGAKLLGKAATAAPTTLRGAMGTGAAELGVMSGAAGGGEALKQHGSGTPWDQLNGEQILEATGGAAAGGLPLIGAGTAGHYLHSNAQSISKGVADAKQSVTEALGNAKDRLTKADESAAGAAENAGTQAKEGFDAYDIPGKLSDLYTSTAAKTKDVLSKIANGDEVLGDAKDFMTASGDKLKTMFAGDDNRRVDALKQAVADLKNEYLTPEQQAAVEAWTQDSGNKVKQAAVAAVKLAKDQARSFREGIKNLADKIADRANEAKFKRGSGGDGEVVDMPGDAPRLGGPKRSEDRSGADAAIQRELTPLLQETHPHLFEPGADNAKALKNVGSVLRGLVTDLSTGEHPTSTTIARLIDVLGPDTPKYIEAAHRAIGDSTDPKATARFFTGLNSVVQGKAQHDNLKGILREQLRSQFKRSTTDSDLGKTVQMLDEWAGAGRKARNDPQYEYNDRKVRELLQSTFEDPDKIMSALEARQKSKDNIVADESRAPRSESDNLEAEHETSDPNSGIGTRDLGDEHDIIKFFGTGNTLYEDPTGHVPKVAKDGKTYPHATTQALERAKTAYPNMAVQFRPATELGMDHPAVAKRLKTVTDALVKEGHAPEEARTMAEKAIGKYGFITAEGGKTETRISKEELTKVQFQKDEKGNVKTSHYASEAALKTGPEASATVIDAVRLTNHMESRNQHLPYTEFDDRSPKHRKARMFMEGVAAVQDQLGHSFEIPDSTVIALRGGKDNGALTWGEVKNLKQIGPTADQLRAKAAAARKEFHELTAGRPLRRDGTLGWYEKGSEQAKRLRGSEADMHRFTDLANKEEARDLMDQATQADGGRPNNKTVASLVDSASNDEVRRILQEKLEGRRDNNMFEGSTDDPGDLQVESHISPELRGKPSRDNVHRELQGGTRKDAEVRTNSSGFPRGQDTVRLDPPAKARDPHAWADWAEETMRASSTEAMVRDLKSLDAGQLFDLHEYLGTLDEPPGNITMLRLKQIKAQTELAMKQADALKGNTGERRAGLNTRVGSDAMGRGVEAVRDADRVSTGRPDPFLKEGRQGNLFEDSHLPADWALPEREAKPVEGRKAATPPSIEDLRSWVAEGKERLAEYQRMAPDEVNAEWRKAADAGGYSAKALAKLLRERVEGWQKSLSRAEEGARRQAEAQGGPPSPKVVAAKKAALLEKARSGDPELLKHLASSDDAKGLQRAVETMRKAMGTDRRSSSEMIDIIKEKIPGAKATLKSLREAVERGDDRLIESNKARLTEQTIEAYEKANGVKLTRQEAVAVRVQTDRILARELERRIPASFKGKVRDYLDLVLGKDAVDVFFSSRSLEENTDNSLGAHGTRKGRETIYLHNTARSLTEVRGVVYHESAHALFARLINDERFSGSVEALVKVAQSKNVRDQLDRIYAHDEHMRDYYQNNPEEAIAYMYQHWAEGKLTITDKPVKTIFEKVRAFLNNFLNSLSDENHVQALFEMYRSGDLKHEIKPMSVEDMVRAQRYSEDMRFIRYGDDEHAGLMHSIDTANMRLSELVHESEDVGYGLQTKRYSLLGAKLHEENGYEGFPATHDSPYRHEGKFDWRKHSGRGEGNAAFGAGTYVSTADGVHRGYKDQFTAKIDESGSIAELTRARADHEWAKSDLDSVLAQRDAKNWTHDAKGNWYVEGASNVLGFDVVRDGEWGEGFAAVNSEHDTPITESFDKLQDLLDSVLDEDSISPYRDAVADAKKRLDQAQKDVDENYVGPSPTYEVSVNIPKEQLLDWDKPLRMQSELVREKLSETPHKGNPVLSDIKNDTHMQLSNEMSAEIEEHGNYSAGASELAQSVYDAWDKAAHGTSFHGDLAYKPFEEMTPFPADLLGRLKPYKMTHEFLTDFNRAIREKAWEDVVADDPYRFDESMRGEQIYRRLTDKLGSQAKASDFLQSLGILGHRYAASGGKNDKHPNYVIYDDSKIKTNYVHFSRQGTDPNINSTGNGATRTPIYDYIQRVLGSSVAIEWAKFAHAGEFERLVDKAGAIQDIIRLSVHALNPLSTAHHEALHAFFRKLSDMKHGEVQDVLEKAATSAPVLNQLRKLLAHDKDALAQLSDPQEAAAYMYQFWADGKLTVGDHTRNFFQKIGDFVRSVLGIWSNDQRALHIMEYFHRGDFNTDAKQRFGADIVGEKLMGPGRNGALETVKKMTQPFREMGEALGVAGGQRLRDTGIPALRELADAMKLHGTAEGEDAGYLPAARAARTVALNNLMSKLKGTSSEVLTAALQSLQTKDNSVFNSLKTPEDRLAAKAAKTHVRKALDDMYQYMKDAGVNVNDLGVGKDYFPRQYDTSFISSHQDEFKAVLASHGVKDPDAVMKKIVVAEGAEFTVETDKPGMQYLKVRTLAHIPDAELAPFLRKDLLGTMNSYITQATRRAEWAARFGDKGERLTRLLADAKQQGATDEQLRAGQNFIRAVDGTLGDTINPEARRLIGNMIVYQNIRLLPLAIFSSVVDPMGIVVRGGTANDAFKAFKRGMSETVKNFRKENTDDDMTKLAASIGTIDDTSLVHTLGALYSQGMVGDTSRKFNDTFFRFNLMEQFNTSMRVAATEAALGFLKTHADGTASKHSTRWLSELGLKPDDIQIGTDGRVKVLEGDGLNADHAGKMKMAINRWVDGAVLRPDAVDKPVWMSDPHFALVAHLKQFVYSFNETILKRVGHEFDHGNYAPAMALASYVPIMIAADTMKGLIQGGGSTPDWKKDWGLGDYIESGIERGGLYGTGQFLVDMLKDIKRGGSGIGALTGPTIEQLTDAVKVMGGREQFSNFAMKSMPANALYAKAFGGTATDPTFAD